MYYIIYDIILKYSEKYFVPYLIFVLKYSVVEQIMKILKMVIINMLI